MFFPKAALSLAHSSKNVPIKCEWTSCNITHQSVSVFHKALWPLSQSKYSTSSWHNSYSAFEFSMIVWFKFEPKCHTLGQKGRCKPYDVMRTLGEYFHKVWRLYSHIYYLWHLLRHNDWWLQLVSKIWQDMDNTFHSIVSYRQATSDRQDWAALAMKHLAQ